VLGRRGPHAAYPDDVKFERSGDVTVTEAGCATVFAMLIQYAEFGRYWSEGPRLFLFDYAAFIVPLAFLMSFGQEQRVEVLLYSSRAERRRRCRNVSFVRIYYTSARHLLYTVCGLQ
jgi:hypothetical protein